MPETDLKKNILVFVTRQEFISILSRKRIPLDTENLHHIRRVLRYDNEITINVSCGDGKYFSGKLGLDNHIEKISEIFEVARPVKTSLINPGIKKKNLELLVQKGTEIGIDNFYFISSNFQNFSVESVEKYLKIAKNACSQSKNPVIPMMEKHNLEIFDFPFQENTFYFWGDPDQNTCIEDLEKIDMNLFSEICFINGPEGGWSPKETGFLKNRFRSVRLSDNVLRTETAALTTLFYIKLLIREYFKFDS